MNERPEEPSAQDGADAMNAALVAVQLAIDAEVLASAERYRGHLEAAGGIAADLASGAGARLIVFPECAGHLALLALAPPGAHRAKTLAAALARGAVRRPLDVLRGVATSRVLHPRHAVLAALAPDGEKLWRAVFGRMAKRHAAYIVAGSHLRIGPDGDVTNASLLFGPDGRCLATTDKVNLVPGVEDGAPGGLGLARGEPDAAPLVDTPLGRIATLIGYDAAAEPQTQAERFTAMGERVARRGGAAIVANPAAQWRRVGEVGSLHASLAANGFARWGVTAQLVGSVLDLSFEGASEVVERGATGVAVLARAAHHDRADHVVARVAC
jgi:predicted amidohydrolase